MYKRFLIATDCSAEGNEALTCGFALTKALSARGTVRSTGLIPATADPTYPSLVRVYEKAASGTAAITLGNAKNDAERGWASIVRPPYQSPPRARHDHQGGTHQDCDLIVVGLHRHGGEPRPNSPWLHFPESASVPCPYLSAARPAESPLPC
jgi:nucleotide-binding universal stress UspA family protein